MRRLIKRQRKPYFHKPEGLKRTLFKRLRPPKGFTLRKRGVKRPLIGKSDLEKRAVSEGKVIGTLPERIVYKELLRRRITFDFQSSLLGGRLKLGGMVSDFILYLPLGTLILRVQTQYFHTTHEAKLKDDEQRAVLESLRDPISGKFFIVYDLWDQIVYDAHRLNDWLNRVLSPKAHTFYMGGPARGVWMPSRAEWNALVKRVAQLEGENIAQEQMIDALEASLFGGSLPPQVVIDTKNLRADCVTADEILANTITAAEIAAGTVTAAEILANTITANKFNLALHYVDGTFTDDSPDGSSVAWASCTVTYSGTTHTITNGNTNNPIIWWDLSSPTAFQTAATYPTLDTTDDIIIGWNTSGTFVPLWQTRSMHGENIIGDTITASEIAAGTITATEITGSSLSAIYADMGTLTAGTVNMYTDTWDDDATGFRLNASEICGQNAGTDQVIISASDGKLKAGAGAVTLDSDGITILSGEVQANYVEFNDGSGGITGSLASWQNATTDVNLTLVQARGTHETDYEDAELRLRAYAHGALKWAGVTVYGDLAGSNYVRIHGGPDPVPLQFNDANTEIWEDGSSNLSFKDANAGTVTLDGLVKVAGDTMTGDLTVGGANMSLDNAGTTTFYWKESGTWRYQTYYAPAANWWGLRTTDSDGGGTDADLIRVPDGQTSVDGNTTFDDNAFDWVCQDCGWHSEARPERCPECGGRVEWQDDAMLMNAVVKAPGKVKDMPTELLVKLEQLGIVNAYGTAEKSPDERQVFVSLNKAHWFSWSAIAQLWRRVQELEQELAGAPIQ